MERTPRDMERQDDSTHESASVTDRISRRAYQRYEERGREDGRDMEDWLEAEREVVNASDDRSR